MVKETAIPLLLCGLNSRIFEGNKIWVFGGKKKSKASDNLYVVDYNNWQKCTQVVVDSDSKKVNVEREKITMKRVEFEAMKPPTARYGHTGYLFK